jgi:hypothetical protein
MRWLGTARANFSKPAARERSRPNLYSEIEWKKSRRQEAELLAKSINVNAKKQMLKGLLRERE